MAIISKYIDGESVLIQGSKTQPYDAEWTDGNSLLIYENVIITVTGRISRSHCLNGLGGQGQMTWNPLG